MIRARPDRLDRHGQVGDGGDVPPPGIPVHDADAAVHALYRGRAAPLVEAAFPGTVDGRRRRPGEARRRGARRSRAAAAARGDHPSAGARGRGGLPARSSPDPRRWSCSTFRCCSRPAARAAATRSWSSRRPPTSRPSACSPAWNDRGEVRGDPGQADAGRRKAPARPFPCRYEPRLRRPRRRRSAPL